MIMGYMCNQVRPCRSPMSDRVNITISVLAVVMLRLGLASKLDQAYGCQRRSGSDVTGSGSHTHTTLAKLIRQRIIMSDLLYIV